jgi:arylsulfatase A-like enzyme
MEKRPNIFVFFTDQQRWDTCSCYNDKLDLTPNLQKMADDGMVFEKTYTCQPVCGPARSSIQSGMYPSETGNFHNLCALKPGSCTMLADYLNRAGYETGYVGKLHLALTTDGPIPEEKRCGYRDWWKAVDVLEWASVPYEGQMYDENNEKIPFKGQYRADFCTDLAIDFLNSRTGEKPFFMMMSLIEPHHQNCMNRYVAPDGYAERYKDAWVPDDLASRPGQGDWEENLPDYYGIIARIDENLGRIMEALKKNGQYEDTVIIFTSDHGSHFRTRNGEYKRACHEACTRIPFVVRGPGFENGKTERDKLVSLIDLPATVLDIAGVRVPEHYRGMSLLPLLRGKEPDKWRDEVFIQISEAQVGRALCNGKYKYSVSAPGLDGYKDCFSDSFTEEFLYDLESDPYESVNLVTNQELENVRAKFREIMIAYIEKIEHRTPEILPAKK